MRKITREQFAYLIKQERVKPKLARDLRFVPEEIDDWQNREMLAVTNRAEKEGVLIIQLNAFYMAPFRLLKRITDKQTGRSKPITCDFCFTWQRGSNAGSITFTASDGHTFSFLCCADLQCSLHVRDKTPQAALSRSQLHEDLTTQQRIERLNIKLRKIIDIIDQKPVPETFFDE